MKGETSKILVINGSYRDDGFIDRITSLAVDSLKDSGAEVETVFLRDYPIEFCLNCRECTQTAGESPGLCVQNDGMQSLVDRIEQSTGFILAVPTNVGSVTAIFKRFMERLVVYAYWPWSANAPIYRKDGCSRKKALIISSGAAPGFLGRWFFSSSKQLKMTARIIGADCIGTLFAGQVAKQKSHLTPEKYDTKIRTLVAKLV
jgi:multimeric flavodoxin WrbA